MEWGIAINLREPVSEIIDKSVIAEKGGIHTIWITDYPATRFSPALAAVIAETTKHCRIGVGLLSPFIYSASHIMQMMSTLIDTYGQRFDLLLGPGDRSKLGEIGVSYGEVTTLVNRMTESVTNIREGLSEYKDCRILIGAQGPRMIEASTCSDGVLLNYSDPDMIRWAISKIENRSEGFMIGIFPPALIGSSKSCEDNISIKTSAAVVALGANRSILRKYGLEEELQPRIEEMRENGLTTEIVERIDQDILDRFCLCGSIETSNRRLKEYQEIGVQAVVFGPPQGASLKSVEQLVEAKKEF